MYRKDLEEGVGFCGLILIIIFCFIIGLVTYSLILDSPMWQVDHYCGWVWHIWTTWACLVSMRSGHLPLQAHYKNGLTQLVWTRSHLPSRIHTLSLSLSLSPYIYIYTTHSWLVVAMCSLYIPCCREFKLLDKEEEEP